MFGVAKKKIVTNAIHMCKVIILTLFYFCLLYFQIFTLQTMLCTSPLEKLVTPRAQRGH
jgi:hypothetical protein